ncbi:hypothetical protein BGX26_010250 [Mortierella sp. AD094]|nr:hypothetical protein BGX26_010250 [Mortierella sp. AD094]
MKYSSIFAAIAAASTVSAHQCPSDDAVTTACNSINVSPLLCNNPKVNVEECNAKQCGQTYIDNYSACQCRRSATDFYTSSANVQGLLNRCGLAGLSNPYGDPNQYKPGQGTQTFAPTSTADGGATRIYDGTTYYGGQTAVVSGTTRIVSATAIAGGSLILPGTTTWVSETPGIVSGTSTALQATSRTAAPVAAPTETEVFDSSHHVSGGSIAGITIGLFGGGSCPSHDVNGPTRTVVTEKIEPVVVRTVPHADAPYVDHSIPVQTNYHAATPITTTTSHPIQHHTAIAVHPDNAVPPPLPISNNSH